MAIIKKPNIKKHQKLSIIQNRLKTNREENIKEKGNAKKELGGLVYIKIINKQLGGDT